MRNLRSDWPDGVRADQVTAQYTGRVFVPQRRRSDMNIGLREMQAMKVLRRFSRN
jgi:hypothetical protein